jgi:cytochrome c-type biogenesis protein CcmE
MVLLAAGVVLAAGVLMGYAMKDSLVFYYPVSQVVQERDTAKFQNCRLNGLVKPGSIQRDTVARTIAFTIMDKQDPSDELPVLHRGLEVPDMFKDNAEVVAEGSLVAADRFESTFLMAKCPSRYEAEYEQTGENPHSATADNDAPVLSWDHSSTGDQKAPIHTR